MKFKKEILLSIAFSFSYLLESQLISCTAFADSTSSNETEKWNEAYKKLKKLPTSVNDYYQVLSGGIWVGRNKREEIDVAIAIYESRYLEEDIVRDPTLKNKSVLAGLANLTPTLAAAEGCPILRLLPNTVQGRRVENRIQLTIIPELAYLRGQRIQHPESMTVLDVEVISKDEMQGTLTYFGQEMNKKPQMNTDLITLHRIKETNLIDVFKTKPVSNLNK